MCRTLLLPLVVGGLALGLPFVRGHGAEHGGRAAASGRTVQETGVLLVSDAPVHFTLYWPSVDRERRTVVIFAADANAPHPRPLRAFARAAAAAGVAAAYLEPTAVPADAAARLRTVLQRQAPALGVDADSVWTWVEGQGLSGPEEDGCRQSGLLAAVSRLGRHVLDTGHLARRTLDWTLGIGCTL